MMFSPGLSALGGSEIRIRQKAKSVSPMQKYEKTLNGKTFRAHFLFLTIKGKNKQQDVDNVLLTGENN